jgi:hypothetical protein
VVARLNPGSSNAQMSATCTLSDLIVEHASDSFSVVDEVLRSSSIRHKFCLGPVFLPSWSWGLYGHLQILLGLEGCDFRFKFS